MASLHSWTCETCTICHLCPPCEPHVYVAPSCECRENMNQCTCNGATQTHLFESDQQWTNHLLADQNDTFAAQINSNRLKRHLLLWLIGLSFVFILILLAMILLIVLPTVSAGVAASVSEARLSYADLTEQWEAQQRLVQQLERELNAVRQSRIMPGPTILSRTS